MALPDSIIEEEFLANSTSEDEKPKDSIPSDPLDLVEYRFKHAVEREKQGARESPAVELFCRQGSQQSSSASRTCSPTKT